MSHVAKNGLEVAAEYVDFIEKEALPGSGVSADDFWQGLSDLVHGFGPENRDLLAKREEMQGKIEAWHVTQQGQPHDFEAYRSFLQEIGYLLPEGDDFQIETANVDPEIAWVPGPQLVVPITNARYALNAANARWGSLYDALYGTDAMGSTPQSGGYDAARGAEVVQFAKAHLDEAVPLKGAAWADVTGFDFQDGQFVVRTGDTVAHLERLQQFVGITEDLTELLFVKNGLHIRLVINPNHPIGKDDPAGIADVVVEAAMSAIMDCEDSVACVDAEDKVLAYRNWLGLMKGDLEDTFEKGGKMMTRQLRPDQEFTAPDGQAFTASMISDAGPSSGMIHGRREESNTAFNRVPHSAACEHSRRL